MKRLLATTMAVTLLATGCGSAVKTATSSPQQTKVVKVTVVDQTKVNQLRAKVATLKAQVAGLKYSLTAADTEATNAYYVGLRDGAHNLGHDAMIEALEMAPTTYEQVTEWEKSGIGYGQLYVTP